MTIEIDNFVERYPELHHYTGWDALKGIFALNTLWATHYKHLNDKTEIMNMKQYLKDITPRNRTERRSVIKKVDQLYEKTFVKFVEPYIVSFSTHANNSTFDQENGIISHWKQSKSDDGVEIGGYGRNGYAIVFDTKRLSDLINIEFDTYCYTQITYSNVVYDMGVDEFQAFFERMIKEASWFLWDKDNEIKANQKGLPRNCLRAEEFINEFIKTTVSFKHKKWEKEQEVRIVAHPKRQGELKYITDYDSGDIKVLRDRKIKNICYRCSNIPIIKLFEDLNEQLPIKRIIVAPDEDQEKLWKQVTDLIRGRVPVHCSQLKLSA
jgi:hypothetical protein